MRYLLLLGIFFFSQYIFAQYVIVETGRPKPWINRNAQEIVGKKIKVKYDYFVYKNQHELDSILSINKVSSDYLESKYGADWRKIIDEKINHEVENLKSLLSQLKDKNELTDENLVYFKSRIFKNKYLAEIYPAIEPENRTKENLIKRIKLKIN